MIQIKTTRLAHEAWQMTLVQDDGAYIGTVTSPLEAVARRMAEAAAREVERFGRMGRSTRPAEAVCEA